MNLWNEQTTKMFWIFEIFVNRWSRNLRLGSSKPILKTTQRKFGKNSLKVSNIQNILSDYELTISIGTLKTDFYEITGTLWQIIFLKMWNKWYTFPMFLRDKSLGVQKNLAGFPARGDIYESTRTFEETKLLWNPLPEVSSGIWARSLWQINSKLISMRAKQHFMEPSFRKIMCIWFEAFCSIKKSTLFILKLNRRIDLDFGINNRKTEIRSPSLAIVKKKWAGFLLVHNFSENPVSPNWMYIVTICQRNV